MTDDTGIIQHATFSVPARETGYCVDDNARALIVALHADRLIELAGDQPARVDVSRVSAPGADRRRAVPESHELRPRRSPPMRRSEDCTGRALWALGTAVHLAGDEANACWRARCSSAASGSRPSSARAARPSPCWGHELPDRATPRCARGGDSRGLAQRLCRQFRDRATPEWRWFEATLTYDNALLPLALWRVAADQADPASREVARQSLAFLEQTCFRGDRLVLVGNDGWHSRSGTRADADEQPIDAAAFVLAFRGRLSGDRRPPLPAAACASRSPGSWAPTGWGIRLRSRDGGLPGRPRGGRRRT